MLPTKNKRRPHAKCSSGDTDAQYFQRNPEEYRSWDLWEMNVLQSFEIAMTFFSNFDLVVVLFQMLRQISRLLIFCVASIEVCSLKSV